MNKKTYGEKTTHIRHYMYQNAARPIYSRLDKIYTTNNKNKKSA